jgi:hypothetical protein
MGTLADLHCDSNVVPCPIDDLVSLTSNSAVRNAARVSSVAPHGVAH